MLTLRFDVSDPLLLVGALVVSSDLPLSLAVHDCKTADTET